MCTSARLVQAGQETEWFGMRHGGDSWRPPQLQLQEGEPAYLEVAIDPAAHGEAGLGAGRWGAFLRIAAGEDLFFELVGDVQ